MVPKRVKCKSLALDSFDRDDYFEKGVIGGKTYRVLDSTMIARISERDAQRELHYLVKLPRGRGSWLLPASMFDEVSIAHRARKPALPVGQVEL
jgi:hypothetical protein